MKRSNCRFVIQGITLTAVVFGLLFYYHRLSSSGNPFTPGKMNPYGGFHALYGYFVAGTGFPGLSGSVCLTLALVVMAVLGGRFFCGFLCPVGTLQDLANRVGRRAGRQQQTVKNKAFYYLKYAILLAMILSALLSIEIAWDKMSLWQGFLVLFVGKDFWLAGVVPIGFLVFFVLLALMIPRCFCRYLCPVGAFQGLFAVFSVSRLTNCACTSCGKCEEACPEAIPWGEDGPAMAPECIRCLDCTRQICPGKETSGMSVLFFGKKISHAKYIGIMVLTFCLLWAALPFATAVPDAGEPGFLPRVYQDGVYEGTGKGYSGMIEVSVTVTGGKIARIEIVKHSESPGWYNEVFSRMPEEMILSQSSRVDAVSGATYTSRGLVESVENALEKAV